MSANEIIYSTSNFNIVSGWKVLICLCGKWETITFSSCKIYYGLNVVKGKFMQKPWRNFIYQPLDPLDQISVFCLR